MSDCRIVIFQPCVPAYRVGLFEGLGRLYGERLKIVAGPFFDKGVPSCPLHGVLMDYTHPIRDIGGIRLQKGLSLKGLEPHHAIVVICGEPRNLSMMWLAIWARLRGFGVLWWGHHKTATSKPWRIAVRLFLTRLLANDVLCYTSEGAQWMVAHGFATNHVFFTGNTIDAQPIKGAIANWNRAKLTAFQQENGLAEKKLLVFCSALRPKVRLDVLLQALSTGILSMRDDIVLAVIGSGEKELEYKQMAHNLDISSRVWWLGAMQDQNAMAPWFLSAKLFVYPGSIGLSILHAFNYGLPVITHGNVAHQMPEFEAMRDGENGLCFEEGDAADLADKILSVIDDERKLAVLSKNAQETATHYTMDQMVANFAEAIEATWRDSGSEDYNEDKE